MENGVRRTARGSTLSVPLQGPGEPAQGEGASVAGGLGGSEAQARPRASPRPTGDANTLVAQGTAKIPACPVHGAPIERRDHSQYGPYFQCSHSGCRIRAARGHDALWRITDQRLRNARMIAHAAFDCLWNQKLIDRSAAYSRMSHDLGIPHEHAHMLHLSVEGCEAVTRWAADLHARLNRG